MTLAGRVFSNRYEVQRELAQGGMAEVYLARDQLLNRPVALKVLFPEYAREPSFVERFRREAQAAANLNHPNIVAIYDWGQESGTYFIVMEYVEGRSLCDLIRSESPLDPDEVAELAAEIASALAFAHRSGVVHRDVKPGNVLLTRSGTVKVTDFGIARAGTSDGLTQTGSVMGTATYFSPEQAQGLPVDGRSDVYSLGVVLYEMLTGVVPFTGDSPVAVAYKHVREDPVPPSQRNADVPAALEQIVLTALAKDPEHRYQTADDLRADLLRFRRGRPLAAAPLTAIVAEVPTATTPLDAERAAAAYAATTATPRVDDRGRYTDGPQYPRKRRNTALIWTLTVLALILIIGGILVAAMMFGSSQEQVTVPSVVGKTEATAKQMITDAHLKPSVQRVSDRSKPIGTVISQSPAGNSKIDRGSTVTLKVSAGASQKQIPFEIVGKTVDQATAQLKALGFKVTTQDQPSDTAAKGTVTGSSPAPGTNADVGSTVSLIVSSGPAPIKVPPVAGQSANAAVAQLQAAGFTTFDQATEASDTVPKDQVIRTDPAAGQEVPRDTRIRIIVSSGKSTVPVPPVVGKTATAAQSALTAKGFTVSQLKVVDDANVGLVVEQDPAANTEVAPGSNVVIKVGTASTPTSAAVTTTTGP